jgi:hypothetical protein
MSGLQQRTSPFHLAHIVLHLAAHLPPSDPGEAS